MTPDSKYVVAGSIGGSSATVIDTELEHPGFAFLFEGGAIGEEDVLLFF